MATAQRITCPHCQGSIKAPPLAPGSICNCPKCGKGFPLPGGTAESAPATPQAIGPVAKPQAAAPTSQPVRTPNGPKPPPPAPIRPLSPTANTATQPAHRQEPPPPKPVPPPPKVVEIPVVCNVCGTRMYAKENQIGETLRCPDCFTDVAVKAPKVAPPPPKKKTLDELEEFQLSDPGERPTYKPMVETRGEYSELQLLDTKAQPRKEPAAPGTEARPTSLPDTVDPMWNESRLPAAIADPNAATVAATTLAPAPPAMPLQEQDLDEQEVVLSAPVQRIETRTEVKVPDVPPPPRDERKEPSWNDAEWGFISDPRAAGAWQKSPFYVGILSIFTDLQLLLRVAAYSIGMAIVFSFFGNGVSGQGLTGIFTLLTAGLLGFLVLMSLSPCLLAIATDTANGDNQVKDWPDWNVTEWIGSAFYIPIAGALAILPGSVIASMFILVGHGAELFSPFPVLVSFLAIFPLPFASIVTESSPVHLISGKVLRSLRSHGDGWITLYVLSFFIFMIATIGVVLLELGTNSGGVGLIFSSIFAAALFVFLIILYFRLLGRLLWYTKTVPKKVTAE